MGTDYGGINIWHSSNVNFTKFTTNQTKNSLSYSVVSSIENNKN